MLRRLLWQWSATMLSIAADSKQFSEKFHVCTHQHLHEFSTLCGTMTKWKLILQFSVRVASHVNLQTHHTPQLHLGMWWDCRVMGDATLTKNRGSNSYSNHMRAISQEIPLPSFEIQWKITYLKFHSNLSGDNNLTYERSTKPVPS